MNLFSLIRVLSDNGLSATLQYQPTDSEDVWLATLKVHLHDNPSGRHLSYPGIGASAADATQDAILTASSLLSVPAKCKQTQLLLSAPVQQHYREEELISALAGEVPCDYQGRCIKIANNLTCARCSWS